MVSNKSPADQATALELLEELGETNVTVIFTNREDINCGAAKAESKKVDVFAIPHLILSIFHQVWMKKS